MPFIGPPPAVENCRSQGRGREAGDADPLILKPVEIRKHLEECLLFLAAVDRQMTHHPSAHFAKPSALGCHAAALLENECLELPAQSTDLLRGQIADG